MNRERYRRLESLFDAAIELTAGERTAFLDRECASDAGLRKELEALLAVAPTLPSSGSATTLPCPHPDERDIAGNQPREMATAPMRGGGLTFEPGVSIYRYELIRELGSGGMGSVYLARDTKLGRRVAIKFLRPSARSLSKRFMLEAQATARCNHENIVVIHEIGEYRGHPYMVLEYLEGKTLRQWLREHAATTSASGQPVAVPPGHAVALMLPVVRALVYAHARGIVHRDLKPENIILTQAGTVKVLDFGIAKLLEAPAPDEESAAGGAAGLAPVHSSARVGTLPYMSPEQMNAGAIDGRSDLWTVGIMLFELVTGRHPLSSYDMGDLVRIADEAEPMPRVSALLPDIGPLGAVIDRCLIKNPADRTPSAALLLAELEALAPGRRAALLGDDGCPFAGLAAFQEGDAERFFGRDHDITALMVKLRSLPIVAVSGPSGAGKSSLVRAGVIPALKRSGEGWEAVIVRPGRQPLGALAEVLLALSVRSSETPTGRGLRRDADQVSVDRDDIIARLRTEPGHLGIALRAWARAKLRRLVLFVDQFEELYTLGASNEERACVNACLGAVADDVASPLRVILSMRSDFLDRLTENRAFLDAVSQGLTFLPPLGRDGLREALIRPVEACDHRFESPAMVERILDELEATRSPLPLLQFTADKLWGKRDRGKRMLTEASLHALGGVGGTLAGHADAVLASMPVHDARLARTVFLRLVTPERTRALATLTELRQLGGDAQSMSRVLTRLIDARLLAVEGRAGSGADSDEFDGVVEIVHESLIDTWPLLGQWLVENGEDAIFLARLRSAARDWERSGHAAGLLWTGEAAGEARMWQQRYQGELAPVERRYLDAVLASAERALRVRRRVVGGLLAVATAVAVVMSWLAWQQYAARREAAALARQERAARQEAAASAAQATQEAVRARDATRMAALRTMATDPTTQMALVREIEGTDSPPPGAVDEAKRLLHAHIARAVFTDHDDVVWSASFSPDGQQVVSASLDKTVRVWKADGTGAPIVLRGHDDMVLSASFSPDGQHVVSVSADKTVRVWRADGSAAPIVLRGHDHAVLSASFSPDGQQVVSTSSDKTVRVWKADGSAAPVVLRGHDDMVLSASFSPDGQRVVSVSADKTVRVWKADGSTAPIVLRGHDEAVTSVSFSPDGRHVVSASTDKTVRVWKADSSAVPIVLRGHHEAVSSASFSPNGRHVISASMDKTMRVWKADGSAAPIVLRGHDKAVTSASFSPDGQLVVSASMDKTVRVWKADGSAAPLFLHGHDDVVLSASFSPDGRHVVSASMDKTVRVWKVDDVEEPQRRGVHDNEVVMASFSPDGRQVVSASADKTVRVWQADSSAAPIVLRGHDEAVSSASFSPDGRQVVSASADKTVRVWKANGSTAPIVLRGHDEAVSSASFSPDGRQVVSASSDTTVRVWQADGSAAPIVLRGHDDVVTSASFSPDGQQVVSASWDKTVRVWKADGSGLPIVLRGHDEGVFSASFSPDGQQVVSASFDKTVRVWKADGSAAPIVLRGHDDNVTSASFSPDGQQVVSASWDKTVRVWKADGSAAPIVLRGHGDWIVSAELSPDGQRVVSASKDKSIRIWRTDGTGVPVVLRGHELWVNTARFSPDGWRVVSASGDGSVRVWHDLAQLTLDDPRLWTVTSYCMSIARRVELLGVSEEKARDHHARCLARVAEARRGLAVQPWAKRPASATTDGNETQPQHCAPTQRAGCAPRSGCPAAVNPYAFASGQAHGGLCGSRLRIRCEAGRASFRTFRGRCHDRVDEACGPATGCINDGFRRSLGHSPEPDAGSR
jgi:WD40 repeat protein